MKQEPVDEGTSVDSRIHRSPVRKVNEPRLVSRKPIFEILTRSDTNLAVQLQKMAKCLKFF